MSSGSYFTLYRKCTKVKASSEVLDTLKNEYFLANKKDLFAGNKDDKALPLLLHVGFKADFTAPKAEDNKTDVYYSEDGTKYVKLLDFHFNSTFTALKEHFNLDPYRVNQTSIFVSKADAKKILQAIEYILSEDYDKKFEKILDNEFVKILGEGYSCFDNRFKESKNPIYIDKEGHGYTVNFGDSVYEAETSESDDDVKFNLYHTRACLLAFLNAEESTWDGEELVLEYSAY